MREVKIRKSKNTTKEKWKNSRMEVHAQVFSQGLTFHVVQ